MSDNSDRESSERENPSCYSLGLTSWICTAFNLTGSHVFVPVIDAGSLAFAGSPFEIPSIVNFNGVIYSIPTGGHLPVPLNKTGTHGFNTASGSCGNSWKGGTAPRTEVQGRYPKR
jgi:hypothetical protein